MLPPGAGVDNQRLTHTLTAAPLLPASTRGTGGTVAS